MVGIPSLKRASRLASGRDHGRGCLPCQRSQSGKVFDANPSFQRPNSVYRRELVSFRRQDAGKVSTQVRRREVPIEARKHVPTMAPRYYREHVKKTEPGAVEADLLRSAPSGIVGDGCRPRASATNGRLLQWDCNVMTARKRGGGQVTS